MAYSWDNRVKFVVRFMYDIDNNGFLDKNDFECLAVRNTIIESKGKWDDAKFAKNKEVMANLWNEIAELADFNKVQIDRDSQSMRHLHFSHSTKIGVIQGGFDACTGWPICFGKEIC